MYQRIRDLREDRDLKQGDIAKVLNCSQACYSYYESGKRDIPTEVLQKLADFYGVSVDYLRGVQKRKGPTRNNVSPKANALGDVFIDTWKGRGRRKKGGWPYRELLRSGRGSGWKCRPW